MKTLITIFATCLLVGCASKPVESPEHGLPNFAVVAPGIARGGQPNTEGWFWLQMHGYTNIIKLNTEKEDSDYLAVVMKMKVNYYPLNWVHQMIIRPSTNELHLVVSQIKPGTYIHCEHGQDRTGLIVGCYRIQQGWDKQKAYDEMLTYGFHPWLQSLQGRWDSLQVKDWKNDNTF